MKKLLSLTVTLIFVVCFAAKGQNSSAIIGKPKAIGKILVAEHDFVKKMFWNEATDSCKALGDGWRLPTKDELNEMYLNKIQLKGFAKAIYWSGTKVNDENVWTQYFGDGYLGRTMIGATALVRAVKDK